MCTIQYVIPQLQNKIIKKINKHSSHSIFWCGWLNLAPVNEDRKKMLIKSTIYWEGDFPSVRSYLM